MKAWSFWIPDNSIFSQSNYEITLVPSFSDTKFSISADALVLNATVKIETARFEDPLL